MSQLHLRFSGTTYEQGLAHGETLRESIEKNMLTIFTVFEKSLP